MAASFSVIITELRKEKGISQKEASLELNVSQALLSHYEKGIRECGLEFLCKAADYYGVTTDYLLGRSPSRYGLSDAFDVSSDIDDDNEISVTTAYRAVSNIREVLNKINFDFGDRLLYVWIMCAYRIIVYGIRSGQLPQNWVNSNVPINDNIFIMSIENTMLNLMKCVKYSPNNDDGYVPLCVRTVVKHAEKLLSHDYSALSAFVDEIKKNNTYPDS